MQVMCTWSTLCTSVTMDDLAEMVDVFEHDGDGQQVNVGQDTACVRGWGADPARGREYPDHKVCLKTQAL